MDIDSLMDDDWYSMCIDNFYVCCACKKITVFACSLEVAG